MPDAAAAAASAATSDEGEQAPRPPPGFGGAAAPSVAGPAWTGGIGGLAAASAVEATQRQPNIPLGARPGPVPAGPNHVQHSQQQYMQQQHQYQMHQQFMHQQFMHQQFMHQQQQFQQHQHYLQQQQFQQQQQQNLPQDQKQDQNQIQQDDVQKNLQVDQQEADQQGQEQQQGFHQGESVVDDDGGVLVGGRSVFDDPVGASSGPRAPPGFKERPLLASDGTAGYGGGEFNTTVLNRHIAPKPQRHKWNRLWGYLSPDYMSAIQMDEVATFSVTSMTVAETISQALLSLDGISPNSVITDATACVGGNAISFLRYFALVNAVELDETRCRMLRHNLGLCLEHERLKQETKHKFIKFGGEIDEEAEEQAQGQPPCELPSIFGNLQIYMGDCLQVCPQLRQDILFLDPPWGGKQYRKRDKVVLYISKKPLSEICKFLGKYTRYLAIKVPFNADLTDLEQDASCQFVKEVELERMKLVVLEFTSTLSSDQLDFFFSLKSA
mmetsp:Transcript_21726/g.42698  ORF Transcript_21726/g.42698 Transcript_21726/m.42698 type:complete len:497 (+) Transcript_21726:1-1491(+)